MIYYEYIYNILYIKYIIYYIYYIYNIIYIYIYILYILYIIYTHIFTYFFIFGNAASNSNKEAHILHWNLIRWLFSFLQKPTVFMQAVQALSKCRTGLFQMIGTLLQPRKQWLGTACMGYIGRCRKYMSQDQIQSRSILTFCISAVLLGIACGQATQSLPKLIEFSCFCTTCLGQVLVTGFCTRALQQLRRGPVLSDQPREGPSENV
jgi:hypothetical protein